jgi:hypothetical protein
MYNHIFMMGSKNKGGIKMYTYGQGAVTYDEESVKRGDVFTTIDVFKNIRDAKEEGDKLIAKENRPVLVISTNNSMIVRCLALSTKSGVPGNTPSSHRDICIPSVSKKYKESENTYIDTSQIFTINVWQLKYKLASVRSDIVDKAVALNLIQDMDGGTSVKEIIQTLRKTYPDEFRQYNIDSMKETLEPEMRERIEKEYQDKFDQKLAEEKANFIKQLANEELKQSVPSASKSSKFSAKNPKSHFKNRQKKFLGQKMKKFQEQELNKEIEEFTSKQEDETPTIPEPIEAVQMDEPVEEVVEEKSTKRTYVRNPIQITCFKDALDLYEEWKKGNRETVCAAHKCTKDQYGAAKNKAKKILLKSNQINATDWKL